MRDIEQKAVRLVTAGNVEVWDVQKNGSGFTRLIGQVTGDTDTYRVIVNPDGSYCSCPWGTNNPGLACSHTIALDLAARAIEEGIIA